MIDYDYIITKPPLDENTLAHYGVKGMKWKRHKNRSTRSSGLQNRKFEIPGAKQGRVVMNGMEYLAGKIRKATGLEGVLNSQAAGETHWVKDPLGKSDWLYNPNTTKYKLRKWYADVKNKKK